MVSILMLTLIIIISSLFIKPNHQSKHLIYLYDLKVFLFTYHM